MLVLDVPTQWNMTQMIKAYKKQHVLNKMRLLVFFDGKKNYCMTNG